MAWEKRNQNSCLTSAQQCHVFIHGSKVNYIDCLKKVFNHPRRSLAEPFLINFNSFQLGLKRFLNQLDHWCKYKCDSFNEYSFRNWNLPTRQNKLNETQQLGLTKQFSRTQGLIHIFFIFIETEVIYSDELSVLKS